MTTTPLSDSTPAEPTGWREANRANWDERVPVHVAGPFYDVPGFVAGRDTLLDFEPAEVGEVDGRTLLHLQCHIGLDTLSWARRGALVTGLDFSAPAVEVARQLAVDIGRPEAEFVTADLYDAVTALGGRTFDTVYTGRGSLCWLPDIDRWARTVAALVRPGGFLYLAEFHPVADLPGEDGRTVEGDYFQRGPIVVDEPGGYAAETSTRSSNLRYQWTHGVGQVVSALVKAGLRLEFLHEHDGGHFRLEPGQGVPLVYTVRATKPTEPASETAA
ncbi:class I SAM-dependent methyltransferase [Kitasatospora sp. NPDC096147]|uniref:class I SAM-dependent methyltransferase n=1 Tax=Kitasatospora sp. NPDC096147 TaxID=3364093 RepID=UPI003817EC68